MRGSLNNNSKYTPAITVQAPLSTSSILTKHVKNLPENMAKNDFVYYHHDKDNTKTTNAEELSLPTGERARLYELFK